MGGMTARRFVSAFDEVEERDAGLALSFEAAAVEQFHKFEREKKSASGDLPVAFADHKIGIMLLPLPPSLPIWIRGYILPFGALFCCEHKLDFVLVGVGGQQVMCHLPVSEK